MRACQRSSASHMFPIPATTRWSTSTSPRSERGRPAARARRRPPTSRLVGEQVGAEPTGDARVELEHRPVPLRRLPPRCAEDEPRLTAPGRSSVRRTRQRPVMRRWLRTVTSPSKRSSRFLPTASTDSSTRPSIARATSSAARAGPATRPRRARRRGAGAARLRDGVDRPRARPAGECRHGRLGAGSAATPRASDQSPTREAGTKTGTDTSRFSRYRDSRAPRSPSRGCRRGQAPRLPASHRADLPPADSRRRPTQAPALPAQPRHPGESVGLEHDGAPAPQLDETAGGGAAQDAVDGRARACRRAPRYPPGSSGISIGGAEPYVLRELEHPPGDTCLGIHGVRLDEPLGEERDLPREEADEHLVDRRVLPREPPELRAAHHERLARPRAP